MRRHDISDLDARTIESLGWLMEEGEDSLEQALSWIGFSRPERGLLRVPGAQDKKTAFKHSAIGQPATVGALK